METPSVSKTPPRRASRILLRLFVISLVVVGVAWYVGGLGGNVRTVAQGKVYRSAQLTGSGLGAVTACWTGNGLEQVIKKDGIQTVLNLRGGSDDNVWYREERDICARLGVTHIDVSMSAIRQPHPIQLQRVLNAFDHARYPILFHCQGGADRSGLVGTLYLNLYQGVPLDEAEGRQVTARYAHFRYFARTGAIDRFFDLYRETGKGMGLREWITNVYPGVFAKLPDRDKSAPPEPRELLTDVHPLNR